MPFLLPNQPCQCTEGITEMMCCKNLYKNPLRLTTEAIIESSKQIFTQSGQLADTICDKKTG